MRVIHVVSGIEAEAAGPSYSVPRLCAALSQQGTGVVLLSVGGPADQQIGGYRDRRFAGDWKHLPILLPLRSSRGLKHALTDEVIAGDLVHSHGLWQMPGIYASRAAKYAKRPFIVAPRGMLAKAALGFSRTRKAVFSRILQDAALANVACFHATSKQEYEEIRAVGIRAAVAIVPNGIDLPPVAPAEPIAADGLRTVLALGRIHPKKGFDTLIRAWAGLERRHPEWRVRIVGPSERGLADELRALARSLGLQRLTIEGPLYGAEKVAAYRQAQLFALPSMNENFGMTVAESLAVGTPVIATRGSPWSGLEREACGWWIDYGVEPLGAALSAALTRSPTELRAMGQRGRLWMARDFEWSTISASMTEVYSWLTDRGDMPSCVHLD